MIVKRCSTALGGTERLFYESVLSELSIPTLRYHGSWEDDTSTWLVLEDAGDDEPSFDDRTWRSLVADWITGLHVQGRALRFRVALPARGPDYFAERLATARAQLLSRLEGDDLDRDDRSSVELAVARCELFAACWPEIDAICRRFPETLVHGDLVTENLRVVCRGDTRKLVGFDWEKSGWGCLALDLGVADCDAYFRANRNWLGASREEFDEFVLVGRLFRQLTHRWTEKSVGKIERGERRLARLIAAAGWSVGP